MAFRRTVARFARHDVSDHLAKWWKKYHPVEGQIRQQLAPHEIEIFGPLFKGMPGRAVSKTIKFVKEAGLGLGAGLFIFKWGLWRYSEISYHHRD